MNAEATEAEVLRGLIPELEAEGYDVFVRPRPPLAPAFLSGFQPDAIAIRADKKLVVEVVSTPGTDNNLVQLSGLFKGQLSGDFWIILLSPTSFRDVL